MHHQPASRIERAAGLLLLLGVVTSVIGVVMFQVRGGASGGLPPSPAYYVWERSFFVTAVAFTAVGFVVFADHPDLGAGRVLARAGATAYLFGGIVGVVAETMDLTSAAVTCTPCSTAAPTATASHSPKRPDRIRHRNCVPDHFGRGGERCSSGSP